MYFWIHIAENTDIGIQANNYHVFVKNKKDS